MADAGEVPQVLQTLKIGRSVQVRVSIERERGRFRLVVREYYRGAESKWRPAQTALHLWEEQLPEFIGALIEASDVLAGEA